VIVGRRARGQLRRQVTAEGEDVLDARGAVRSARISAISARVWPWHVRWAIGVIEVSRRTQLTISWVRALVLPPAPYVTDTKLGASGSSSAIVCPRDSWAPSVLGGKNSKE
jgi:hypothetical protein